MKILLLFLIRSLFSSISLTTSLIPTTTTPDTSTPTITESYLNESKITIKWEPNRVTTIKTRYIIEVIKANKESFEYPGINFPKIEFKKMLIFELIAQIEFIEPKGSYNQVQNKNNYENTESSFECFSKCINDTDCQIVARYHPSISDDFKDCVKITDESSIIQVQDAQYAKISSICHLF